MLFTPVELSFADLKEDIKHVCHSYIENMSKPIFVCVGQEK